MEEGDVSLGRVDSVGSFEEGFLTVDARASMMIEPRSIPRPSASASDSRYTKRGSTLQEYLAGKEFLLGVGPPIL